MGTGAFAQVGGSSSGIDERFAIASKRFDDGQVQLHTQHNSRRDGSGRSTYTVYSFNCLEQTYEKVFEGDSAPENIPAQGQGAETQYLNAGSDALPLAQQACNDNGLQILELKW